MGGSRPLVMGAGGQVGSAFVRLLPDSIPVTRRELDLSTAARTDLEQLVDESRPSAVINCAAYTAVDQAEAEEDLATLINGRVVGWFAEVCAERGTPLLTYSTDYVFDGEGTSPYLESHPTDPINAYGRSKRVGEEAVLETGGDALIVRTSWVLSTTHRNFVTAILNRAVERKTLKVVNDQVGCPTVADDLAAASWAALEAGARGLLHLTNRGETTWFELARTAVERAGLDVSLVTPCTTEEYLTLARRPSYSVLGSEVAGPLGLDPLPPWHESIDGVVTGSLALIQART